LTCGDSESPIEEDSSAAPSKKSKKDKKKKRKSLQLLETELEPLSAGREGDDPELASGVTAPPEATPSTTEPVTSGAVSAEPKPIVAAPAADQQQQEPLITREPDLEPTPSQLTSDENKDGSNKTTHGGPDLELPVEQTHEPSTPWVLVDETQSSAPHDTAAQPTESEIPSQQPH
jgi:hypothetical protein